MSCLDIIADYGLRSIGLGERLLPRSDFTLCHQFTLIGSGMIWNIYFGTLALTSGFILATLLALGKASKNFYVRKLSVWFIFIFRGSPLFIQFFFAYFLFLSLKQNFTFLSPLISLLSFLNIIYSYYFNLYLNLDSYVYTFFSSSILTIIFFKIKSSSSKPSIFDKILTVTVGYFIFPIILSIPFYFSIYNLTYLNAFFESVSGFTSTGFSIFDNIKHIDQGLILWRSSIQWIGGLYFLFSIIFLIDIYDDSLKKSLTNFLSFNSSEVIKQTIKIFLLYSSITVSIFLMLNIFGIRAFNSLNLAMTIISSGGFLPVNQLSTILISDTQIIIFSLLMLVSFFSIFFIYKLTWK